jgi:hypothetical protein
MFISETNNKNTFSEPTQELLSDKKKMNTTTIIKNLSK